MIEVEADGEAIQIVNEAAVKYFVGNAQLLKKLETVEISFRDNAMVVLPANSELINVIGELSGVVPVGRGDKKSKDNISE